MGYLGMKRARSFSISRAPFLPFCRHLRATLLRRFSNRSCDIYNFMPCSVKLYKTRGCFKRPILPSSSASWIGRGAASKSCITDSGGSRLIGGFCFHLNLDYRYHLTFDYHWWKIKTDRKNTQPCLCRRDHPNVFKISECVLKKNCSPGKNFLVIYVFFLVYTFEIASANEDKEK